MTSSQNVSPQSVPLSSGQSQMHSATMGEICFYTGGQKRHREPNWGNTLWTDDAGGTTDSALLPIPCISSTKNERREEEELGSWGGCSHVTVCHHQETCWGPRCRDAARSSSSCSSRVHGEIYRQQRATRRSSLAQRPVAVLLTELGPKAQNYLKALREVAELAARGLLSNLDAKQTKGSPGDTTSYEPYHFSGPRSLEPKQWQEDADATGLHVADELGVFGVGEGVVGVAAERGDGDDGAAEVGGSDGGGLHRRGGF